MSKELVFGSTFEPQFPKFYIYKLIFKSGATYIGSHIEKKENDGYITSSSYFHKMLQDNNDELQNREILFYLPTVEQMNVMETICIISDKINNNKNVNGNYGNWLSENFSGWNKGLKMPKEFGEKISKSLEKSSKERGEKISKANKGKPKSADWKQKASESWTEERKEKQREYNKTAKRHKWTDEEKKQISEKVSQYHKEHPGFAAHTPTQQQKEKQSQVMKEKFANGEIIAWSKGKIMSEEFKKKVSDGHKGKALSDKHKESIKLGNKQRIRVLQISTGRIFNSMRECENELLIDRSKIRSGYYPDLKVLD